MRPAGDWALALRNLLNARGLSFAQCADLLNEGGYKMPSGNLVQRSSIAAYVSGRVKTPRWVIDALTVCLQLPQGWEYSPDAITSQGVLPEYGSSGQNVRPSAETRVLYTPIMLTRPITEAAFSAQTDESLMHKFTVPAFYRSQTSAAIPVTDDHAAPHFRSGDYVVVERTFNPRVGRIYAVTLPDGSGQFRKMVYDPESKQDVLRAASGRDADVIARTATLDALVVGLLRDYTPGNEVDIVFNERGLRLSEW